jgi:predicted DNA-binding protein (MmcQ/YjbR family)
VAKQNRLKQAEKRLRKRALAYPQAYEEFPWGHYAFKVNGKAFLFMSLEEEFLSLSLKLPVTGKQARGLPFASPTGYGLGRSGWVTARFEPNEDVPMDMLAAWLDESYRAIAPKKLVAQLGEEASGAP